VEIACLDLEGVLVPEIWIALAEKTGIEELKRTTRDEPNYDLLMTDRLNLLRQHGLKLDDIQSVIATLQPLDGAIDFIEWLKERFQVVILSDTFYEFANPLMKQLGYPTLFCHKLEIEDGHLTDYRLRQSNPKRQAVVAFKSMYYRTIAAGDSYNDLAMLEEVDAGILFRAPQSMADKFPKFPSVQTFTELKNEFISASSRNLTM
jgi:phosphoserine/homoserine phosphotransferase